MDKTVAYSRSVLAQVMLIDKANSIGNIHGGEIVKLMDSTAATVTKKHSRCAVVTARIDKLEFHIPVRVGNLITCTGELVFVGKSSMEVRVRVEIEDLRVDRPPKLALEGYFTMVAISDNGVPVGVPGLILETPEEIEAFEEGKKRRQEYKKTK